MNNEKIVNRLIELEYKLTAVECCTAGEFISSLVDVSGASTVIEEALILYSNEAKIKRLAVDEEIFIKYGSVSAEAVETMAYALKEIVKADVYVVASSIVGPGGGTLIKPVGTSYIAILVKDKLYSFYNLFEGNRKSIKTQIVNEIQNRLIEVLK